MDENSDDKKDLVVDKTPKIKEKEEEEKKPTPLNQGHQKGLDYQKIIKENLKLMTEVSLGESLDTYPPILERIVNKDPMKFKFIIGQQRYHDLHHLIEDEYEQYCLLTKEEHKAIDVLWLQRNQDKLKQLSHVQ